MWKSIKPIFIPFALLTLAAACSKPSAPDTHLGSSEFTFTPLASEGPEERDLGRAILVIKRAEGGLGSGFFISPDGLFITNEHVLPRSRCSTERCAGLQMIRDLTYGGDTEVFSQVQILASDAELDFTLGRVISKTPVRVPYIKMAPSDAEGLNDVSLKVFGHPFGSSIHTLTARFVFGSSGKMQLRSPVLPGNSGGPIVDMRSRRVVGVINEMIFHVENADRDTGFFENSAQGIEMGAIRTALAKAFPLSDGADELNVSMFEKPQLSAPDMFIDLLPKTRDDVLAEKVPNASAFVAQFLGTAEERRAFENNFLLTSKLAGRSQAALGFLRSLLVVQNQRGGEVKDSTYFDRLVSLIDKKHFESDQKELKTELDVTLGLKQKNVCLSEMPKKLTLLEQLSYAGRVCKSRFITGDRPVTGTLAAYYDQFRSDFENQKGLARTAINIINRQLQLQVPTTEEITDLTKILKSVETRSRAKGLALQAEGTRCFLETQPKLISQGAFADTF
jgi:hypothetical protein